MEKKYVLKNIKANDFSYRLEEAIESKSISVVYDFEVGNNILTLSGNPESINNDFVSIKECIHMVNPDIVIEEYIPDIKYRKVLTLKNLDCANCASKVERIASRSFSYDILRVDFATSRFIIETKDKELFDNLEAKVQEICKQVDRNIIVIDKANQKPKEAPKDSSVNKVLFIIGTLLMVIVAVLHYIVLPLIAKNSDTFVYETLDDKYISNWWLIGLSILSYICLGGDVLLSALATIVALVIRSYIEAMSVMLFYKIGELLQDHIVNKSRDSISALMDIKPQMARLLFNDNEMEVYPAEIVPGDIIIVKPGEKIPLDGIVIDGEASLDTSALTGESKYLEVGVNSKVISGSVNVDGNLKIKVLKAYQDSMISKILDMVENANTYKGKTEKFITKFAKYYTPVVCILALIIVVGSILIKQPWHETGWVAWHDSIYPGMIFLVVSCPCALVISVPLSYFGAIGGAGKKGILIKGGNYLEQLANVERIIFDKTGTLTKGKFKIRSITSLNEEYQEEDIFRLAAYAEITTNHPIATSIVNAYGKDNIELSRIEAIDVNRKGAIVKIDDEIYVIGNYKKLFEEGIKTKEINSDGLTIYIATNKKCIGYIILEDEIREDALECIQSLKEMGYKITMLTGDNEEIAASVAKSVEIDEYYTNLTPLDKVKKLRKLKKTIDKDKKQVFVGDGINDAPVLGNADIGIAMGNLGSDIAIEIADVVLLTDELKDIPTVLKIAKKTRKIVYENIIFALAVKLIVLVLAVILEGIPLMWEAIFADVGVSLIAILNSLRSTSIKYPGFIKFLQGKKE